MLWMSAAVASAVFAGITSILAKCGIRKTDSDVATALRTGVVLLFSWFMVFVVGSIGTLPSLAVKSLIFLILSGLATGASWICYFKALSMADVNKVVPIDKSGTILTVLSAMLLFGELNNLWVKIGAVLLIGIGVFLMIEKKAVQKTEQQKGWMLYAVLSAVFAAATSILAKIGISGVDSHLGTAIRTVVVFVMSIAIVFGKGKGHKSNLPDKKEGVFIFLSGLATGASWLCYYYAIQNGVVSIVVPIDKLSILVTVAFSCLFLKEKLSLRAAIGLCFMVGGTLLMAIFG